MSGNLYTLLVGIDSYPSPVPKLQGCVNDVRMMQTWLTSSSFNQASIKLSVLENEAATRAAIIEMFRNHLGKARSGDTALFYFSGHGSRELAPIEYRDLEPDGLQETLVAYDSREEDGWDLADKELAVLIAEVAAHGVHMLIILDSCHSGSATRAVDDLAPRRIASHGRERPSLSFWFHSQHQPLLTLPEALSGWRILPEGSHILLAACRNFEQAVEFNAPDGQRRGLFSYYLLETLQRVGTNISYRQLYQQVQILVGTRNPSQLPQAEGNLMQIIFGRLPHTPQATRFVRQVAPGQWRLDGGQVHGIQAGTKLAVLPAEVQDYTNLTVKLAVVQVTEVGVAESLLDVVEGQLPPEAIALPSIVIHLPLAPLRVAVASASLESQEFRTALEASPFLRVEQGSLGTADIVVHNDADYWRLRRAGTTVDVIKPLTRSSTDISIIIGALEHIARWQTLVNLNNPGSPLATVIQMEVFEWAGPRITTGSGPQVQSFEDRQEMVVSYRRLLGGEFQAGRVTVKITNSGDHPVFFALLALSESFSVKLLRGGHGYLPAGQSFWVRAQDGIPVTVPTDMYRRGVTRRRDILLLLAGERNVDFSVLEQEKLEEQGWSYEPKTLQTRDAVSPDVLTALMRRISLRARELDDEAPPVAHQWSVMHQVVVAEREAPTHQLNSLANSYELGGGVVLEVPTGLLGTAKLVSFPSVARDIDSRLLPPSLHDPASPVQPVSLTEQIGSDPGLAILELQGSTFSVVTAAQPLRLTTSIRLQSYESLLAFVFDGQDYLLIGGSSTANPRTIVIPRLPQPMVSGEVVERRRDLAGTIRIVFQKLVYPRLGLPYQYPLLRAVRLDSHGQVAYSEVDSLLVKDARRIALLIHGITGDTRWMAQHLLQTKLLSHYDLVLSFDYDSFNTQISTTARDLKRCFQQLGILANHGKTVHCIAHSMGGLVARWLIEREDGDSLIEHLIMLGTPNNGSPLPNLQNWVFLGGSLWLGKAGAFPPALVLAALARGVEALDVALDELAPKSETLANLNSSAKAPIPYTVIAGDATSLDADLRLFGKVSRQGASLLFRGEVHDLAVSRESMIRIRDGKPPQPRVIDVPCTHMNYFDSSLGRLALESVLQELRAGREGGT